MLSSLLSDAAQDNSVQDTGPDMPVTAGALTAPVIQRSGRGANVHDVPVASVRTCVPPPPRGAGLRPIFDPAPVTACGMDTAKPIALALQGGGAHAAFCWGVLDRLLEDERLEIEAISATSTGAMNAACVAYGMAIGGPQVARRVLRDFWDRIADAVAMSPMQPTWLDRVSRSWGLDWSPAYHGFELMTRLFSPYEFNPLNLDPLRAVLTQVVDFDVLSEPTAPVRLFLSATHVRSGQVKQFTQAELGLDAVLACACQPFLSQAVEIDGEPYWDGSYGGGDAMFPLMRGCDATDVVVVHATAPSRDEAPRTAHEILARVNEIGFNAALWRELRAVRFVTDLIETGQVRGDGLRRVLVHSISNDSIMAKLGASSRMNGDRVFLSWLRDRGRESAAIWLSGNYDRIGVESTIDMDARGP